MPALPLHLPLSLPRFLPARTPARLALLHAAPLAGVQRAPYANRAQKERSSPDGGLIRKHASEPRSGKNGTYRRQPVVTRSWEERLRQQNETNQLRTTFLEACRQQDLCTMLELYPGLAATKSFNRTDTRAIAAALHQLVRTKRRAHDDTSLNDVLIFADRLVSDIRTGVLMPQPHAHLHLLGLYKESERYTEGYVLWQWLVDRGPHHVNAGVYGAALELMAYGKILPLSELETLYVNALKRFPGVFAEYHLSPDAVVPDRTQPIAIPDLPVSLLQGILTARLVYGDWRNAYLALDTALRLFPVQLPPRFFEVFMIERPCDEAYMAFLLACRSGVLFKPSHLTNLLKRLRQRMKDEKVSHLAAMANAIYAYLESGGFLHSLHVSSFIRAFADLDHGAASVACNAGDAANAQNALVTAAHEFTKTWIQAGLTPTADIFTALIDVAGKCNAPSLFQACLQDLEAAKLQPSRSHSRIIISAAASLGDKNIVESYWSRIASEAEAEGKQLEHGDWIVLSRACAECGHNEFFRAQLIKYDHMLESSFKETLTSQAFPSTTPQSQMAVAIEPREWEDVLSEIQTIETQVRNIAAVIMSGRPLDFRRTPFYMSLDPTTPPLGSQDELRPIYDALTTDPHQPPLPVGSVAPVLNPLGIPLDELRFQNWVSVLEMMKLAKLQSSQEERSEKLIPPVGSWDNRLPITARQLGRFICNLRGTKVPGAVSHRPLTQPIVRPDFSNALDRLEEHNGLPTDQTVSPAAIPSSTPSLSNEIEAHGLTNSDKTFTRMPTLTYYIALKPTHNAPVPKDKGSTIGMERSAVSLHK